MTLRPREKMAILMQRPLDPKLLDFLREKQIKVLEIGFD